MLEAGTCFKAVAVNARQLVATAVYLEDVMVTGPLSESEYDALERMTQEGVPLAMMAGE